MLSAMTIHGSIDYQKDPTSLLILLDFDASMVCPCGSEVTHRARNMEAVPRKEHDSTCRQSVWDATTEDIHHDNLVPNTWWAAENTQPCVRMHHTCRQSKEPSKTTIKVWSTFPQEHVSCIFMYFRPWTQTAIHSSNPGDLNKSL